MTSIVSRSQLKVLASNYDDAVVARRQRAALLIAATLLDQFRHECRPSRLVARAQACPRVTIEVFVEQYIVAPMGIGVETFDLPVHRATAFVVAQEQPAQTLRQIDRDLVQ